MELNLKRIKCTSTYTESVLTDAANPRLFQLHLVEPPVRGLSQHPLCTLSPGRYKLFCKTHVFSNLIIPRFQKVAGHPFLHIVPLQAETHIPALKFVPEKKFEVDIWAGRKGGENLVPDTELFTQFITRLCIAKQMKEIIYVNVSNQNL